MKYLIKISYDGSKFYGFQRLNDLNTVQKTLEEALSIINKDKVIIKGAGRTDRGVHAKGQYCHFELNYEIPPKRLINAINSIVNPYINVVSCKEIASNFHARFDVKEKIYDYKINMGEFDLFKYDYEYQLNQKLDIKKMQEASKYLIGVHDYTNFVSGPRKNFMNEIFAIEFIVNDNLLTIRFHGKSFYRYMVRNMVGILIKIGLGKLEINEIKKRIDNPKQKFTSYTVLSNGLYLVDIIY